MSNAKKTFERITDIKYIEEHLVGEKAEDTWLDCKLKDHYEKDKSSFAKALSGFANTSGGVLIFGINARKDKKKNIDVMQGIVSIKQLSIFESKLRELETRIIERSVPGLEYKPIYTNKNDDEGIIVIYIPEGPNPPYRNLNDSKFYIRTGDSFSAMDLPQIESLVLKNIKPDLDIHVCIKLLKQNCTFEKNSIITDIHIVNIGRALAKNVLLEVRLPEGAEKLMKFDGYSYHTSRDFETGLRTFSWSYASVIHPNRGTEASHSSFKCLTNIPFLIFDVLIYAENMPRKKYSVNICSDKLAKILIDNYEYKLEKGKDIKIVY